MNKFLLTLFMSFGLSAGLLNAYSTGLKTNEATVKPTNYVENFGTTQQLFQSITSQWMGYESSVSLALESKTVAMNERFCVQITAREFKDILGMQFSLSYDPEVLEFVEVSNFGLEGIKESSFGLPAPNTDMQSGDLTFVWVAPTLNAVALNPGDVIFEACFVAKKESETIISFAKEPTNIEITNTALDVMDFEGIDSKVSIGQTNQFTGQDTVMIGIENQSVRNGESLCVDIAADEFINMVGMQFTLTYDPELLELDSVGGYNLVGLTDASFGLPGASADLTPGIVTVSWLSAGLEPVTLMNGISMFRLCFTAKREGSTDIAFENMPTSMEFVNINNEQLPYISANGTVKVRATGDNASSTADGFTLTMADQNVQPGDQFCVPVTVQDFNSIIGMQLSINYDPAVLTFSSVGNFNLSGLNEGVFGTPGGDGTDPGVVTLVWVEPALTPATVDDGTAIFEICFTAQSEASTSIIFSDTPTSIEVTNGNEENVPFTGVDANIVVGAGGDGGNNGGNTDGFTLTLEDQNLSSGDPFCVPVTVQNFDNIIGMQLSINYDPDALEFESLTNFNLSGLSEGVFGTPDGSGTDPGVITLVWVEPALMSQTLDDGTVIFEICFNPRSTNASTDIVFSDTPTSIEITNGDEENVPFNGQDATISFDGGGNSGGGEEGFQLEIADGNVRNGAQISLPVTVRDFDNIIGIQLSINYDPNALQFDGLQNFDLSGLTEGSFGLPPNGTTAGNITLVWVEPALSPVTLDDGAAIFELVFTALGDNSTSTDVVFSNTPTSIEITDGNEQSVDFNGENSTVTIADDAVGEGALTLSMDTLDVGSGAEFCIDVTTRDFTSLVGIQFSIAFDPSILEFREVNNFDLSGLTATQFATPSNGRVTLAWVDPDLNGVTVEDGTAIFSLCFTAVGEVGDVGLVEFAATPTAIEITKQEDGSEIAVDLMGNRGQVNISDMVAPSIVSPAVITDAACNGESSGSVDIEIENGSGNYTYAWSNGETTQDIFAVAVGSYIVTVTDTENGLTTTGTFEVGEAAAITIDSIAINGTSCFGGEDASIDVMASGGTGNLIFSWNFNLPPQSSQADIRAGNNYMFTITDENGCTFESDPIEVPQPSSLRPEAMVTPEQCTGASDGIITLTVEGGTPDYQFDWSGDLSDGVSEQTGLAAGTYSVTVTDANGCVAELTEITVGLQDPITITAANTTDITSGLGGSINISVSGGGGDYNFMWDGPGNVMATTEDISGLTIAGDYCVTITDGGVCSLEECITVYNALSFGDTMVNNTCAGENNGSIIIDVDGGAAPLSYRWSNGDTTKDLTGLENGIYTLTVTDAREVSINTSFNVGQFDPLVVNGNIIEVTGNPQMPNGRVNLTISGGDSPYTVQWDNGTTSQVLSGVPVGTYCVTVTDDNGCTFEGCYEVTFQPLPLEVAPRFDNVSCQGESDGAVFLIIQGGITPYTIEFSDGDTRMNSNGLINKGNLPGGELGYIVTDASGAVVEGSVTIQEFEPVQITNVTVVHDTDAPGCTGSISLQITGGAPGINVDWSSPNSGRTIINLCEGEYTPTVVDGNGCTLEGDPIMINTFAVTGEVQQASCQDSPDGSINLDITGGDGNYTFTWRNDQGTVVSQEEDPGNLMPGRYTVTVNEGSGNSIIREFVIEAASIITVEVEVLSDFNGFDVSCQGALDGEVRAVVEGGDGNYSYEWVINNTMVGMNATLENADAGAYELTVIDGSGCSTSTTFELTAPLPLSINASTRDVSCNGADDGEIVVIATGGAGNNYSYTWADGVNGSRRSFLSGGTYDVTVSDGMTCMEVLSFEIVEPEPIEVTVSTTPADDGCNGAASATVKGGTAPYTYLWNIEDPTRQVLPVPTGLCPGEYMVEVIDANGCRNDNAPVMAQVKDRRFPCLETSQVITPNGDGLNEEFIINCIDDLNSNLVRIYNRHGQLVFEANNYDNSWAARTIDGEELPEGPYYYVLEYFNVVENRLIQVKGSINVVRE